jgi:hypothetical protein
MKITAGAFVLVKVLASVWIGITLSCRWWGWTDCVIDFLNCFVDVSSGNITIVSFEGPAGVIEQVTGFGKHLIRFPLTLAVISVPLQFHIQGFACGFDMFHGPSAMTLVIVIGVFEENVGVDQFLAGRFGVNTRSE